MPLDWGRARGSPDVAGREYPSHLRAGVEPAPPGMPVGQIPRTLQVYPPELYPIAGAVEFRKNIQFNSPAVGVVTPAGLVTQLPAGHIGIIRVFGYGLLAMTAATVVSWSLRINEVPQAGYSFTFFPGAVPRVTTNEDIWLRVTAQGAKIDVAFTNTDGAVYTAGANYSGWSWDAGAGELWTGGTSQ